MSKKLYLFYVKSSQDLNGMINVRLNELNGYSLLDTLPTKVLILNECVNVLL